MATRSLQKCSGGTGGLGSLPPPRKTFFEEKLYFNCKNNEKLGKKVLFSTCDLPLKTYDPSPSKFALNKQILVSLIKYLSFNFIFFTFSIICFLLNVVWRYYPTGRVISPICTF